MKDNFAFLEALQQIARDKGISVDTLLDADGHPTRTLGAGAGLLAATRYSQSAPVWVITGTNAAGVELAAKAFNQSTLHNRFAVALTASGTALAVPQPSHG